MTARETAKRLAISERHLQRLTVSGQFPCVRVGKSLRYKTETIQKWVRDAESFVSPSFKNDTSKPSSNVLEWRPRTKLQLQPKEPAKQDPAKKKTPLQENDLPKNVRPNTRSRTKEDQSQERISPLTVLLNELGIDRSSLPSITNGELMRIAQVDIATMHGWQYLRRPLHEEAMNKLREHFRRMSIERSV